MTLDELHLKLKALLGARAHEAEFTSNEHPFGDADHRVELDGKILATWKSDLLSEPVFDGKTHRGPSDYFDYKEELSQKKP